MDDVVLWSAIHRKGRSVYQENDTNMLVEAWHHLLKGHFLEGKRNRRLDHLLHILINETIPYFIQRHHRQRFGFEGPNLEVKRRMEIEERAKSINADSISILDALRSIYTVQSQSNPAIKYQVDIPAYNCTCLSFPSIRFCKHICATQKYYPEVSDLYPASALSSSCARHYRQDTTELDSDSDDEDADSNLNDDDDDDDSIIITDIKNKLQLLMRRFQLHSPTEASSSLRDLQRQLDTVIHEHSPSDLDILPPRKKVAPNQHSWTETAASYGSQILKVPVKTGTKRKHLDPHSGGQKSGDKAKPDARSQPYSGGDWQPAKRAKADAREPLNPSPLVNSDQVQVAELATSSLDTYDISNLSTLQRLSRQELGTLCRKYGEKIKGTNEDIIERLQQHHRVPATLPLTTTNDPGSSSNAQSSAVAMPTPSRDSTAIPQPSSQAAYHPMSFPFPNHPGAYPFAYQYPVAATQYAPQHAGNTQWNSQYQHSAYQRNP